MNEIRISHERNDAFAEVAASLMRAMAAAAAQPIPGGCLPSAAGSLPTGQSAAARYAPLLRIAMRAQPRQTSTPDIGTGYPLPAA